MSLIKVCYRFFCLFVLLVFTHSTLSAAEINYICSLQQGFNFQKDSHVSVGFIESFKIGDIKLISDFSVTDPENIADDKIKVFGVLSGIYWEGGVADPIQFAGHVSTDNKNTLASLIHRDLKSTEVEIVFCIYDYDYKQKKYFKRFHTNGEVIKGLIEKQDDELSMNIDMDEGQEVVSPKNYSFDFSLMSPNMFNKVILP